MSKRTLIRNVSIPSGDGKRLETTDMLIEGGRIEAIGKALPVTDARVVDAAAHIAIPGMVNTHWHAMSNILKGRYHGYPLEIWRQYTRGVWGVLSGRQVYVDAMLGLIEMLENGATTVLEHAIQFRPTVEESVCQSVQAFIDLGIRGVPALMVSDMNYEKTIPLDTSKMSASERESVQWISAKETSARMDKIYRYIELLDGKCGRVRLGLGPAAPQRCTDEMLLALKKLSDERRMPLHMHVLETKTQSLHTQKQYGKSAIAHLDELGVLDTNLSMAHVVWVDDEDIARIADKGASVVHNPDSNLRLGSGIAKVAKMLAKGVNVAIGTDGACSNDGQSMFGAMKLTGLLQNLASWDYADWLDGRGVFRMASENGAKALGMADEIGTLEVGKRADILLLRRGTVSFTPMNNFYEQLVFSENGKALDMVFVDGEMLVENGSVISVDKAAILREAHDIQQTILEEAEKTERTIAAVEDSLGSMYKNAMRGEVI